MPTSRQLDTAFHRVPCRHSAIKKTEGLFTTLCGTRRALVLGRALPFKLGRITRIGGSANYPSAGLGVNYSAGRALTGAEEGVVGSGAEDHDQRKRLVAASAARSLEQGAPHRSETSVEAERCLDHTGPAPVGGAKTSPRVVQPCYRQQT